jgi:dynactin complex subunit
MFILKLKVTKSDYIKLQKKMKKNKAAGGGGGSNSNNNNNQRRSERIGQSGVNSLNSSLSEVVCLDQIEINQKQKYENEISNLRIQLKEHKLKEMELYHEKENLYKQIESYKEANLVILPISPL